MSLLDQLNGLRDFLASDDDYLWLIDQQVFLGEKEESFLQAMAESEADFLATEIRTRRDDPDWHWWSTLNHQHQPSNDPNDVAALLPLCRFSRKAAKAVVDGWAAGWQGFEEALIPTLIARAGLRIEEIGGDGPFTPEERRGQWYDGDTWHWETFTEFKKGKLHFPMRARDRPLAPGRLDLRPQDGQPRILFATPAGGGEASMVEEMTRCFHSAGADCRVFCYDGSKFDLPDGAKIIHESGHKWQFAYRHLKPDSVSDYDYLFFWDDDLDIGQFDPFEFVRIMHLNRLSMAQPAIESEFGLSHEITRRKRCGSPWLFKDSAELLPVAGRLTNFVEIMAPVFTREAWREFHGYLTEENRSGWGYDHIPLPRKGIIDTQPVIHTRPVSSINGSSEGEIRRFLDSQGLTRHPHVEQGLLFGPPLPVSGAS